MKRKKESRNNLCPAPECGTPVLVTGATDAIVDRRERPWHRMCALQALGDHFRTPLDLDALEGEVVEFEVPGEHGEIRQTGNHTYGLLRAPRDFILRAIRFGGDFGLYAAFIGTYNVIGFAPMETNAVFGDDLDSRLLYLSEEVGMGVDITLELVKRVGETQSPRLTLIGELYNPARGHKVAHDRAHIAVGGLYSDEPVKPQESIRLLSGGFYTPTHYERLAVDDHDGWFVEGVKICCFAGDLIGELAAGNDGLVDSRTIPVEPRQLRSRITVLPTFLAQPGETVAIFLRNNGSERRFSGRLLGVAK